MRDEENAVPTLDPAILTRRAWMLLVGFQRSHGSCGSDWKQKGVILKSCVSSTQSPRLRHGQPLRGYERQWRSAGLAVLLVLIIRGLVLSSPHTQSLRVSPEHCPAFMKVEGRR